MVDRSSPETETPTTVQEALAILKWFREPDHVEEFSLEDLANWLNRRPIAAMCRVTDRCVEFAQTGQQWMPIATAPKGNAPVLLYCHSLDIGPPDFSCVGYRYNRQWSNGHEYVGATHWQPLPAAPSDTSTLRPCDLLNCGNYDYCDCPPDASPIRPDGADDLEHLDGMLDDRERG